MYPYSSNFDYFLITSNNTTFILLVSQKKKKKKKKPSFYYYFNMNVGFYFLFVCLFFFLTALEPCDLGIGVALITQLFSITFEILSLEFM